MYRLVTFAVILLTIFVSSVSCDECNKAVCASIVSKCQLLERCNCERSNSTCLSDCFRCLDYLYMECCSCVSICPKSNDTLGSHLMQSHAEDLPEPMPSLFAILTEQEDQLLRWTTHTTAQQVSFVTISGADVTENTFAAGTKVTLKDDGLDEEENVQVNSDHCTWKAFMYLNCSFLLFLDVCADNMYRRMDGRLHATQQMQIQLLLNGCLCLQVVPRWLLRMCGTQLSESWTQRVQMSNVSAKRKQ